MILFILPLFSGGGAERVTINLMLKLHSRGHNIGLIVLNKRGPLIEKIPSDINIYDLKTQKLRRSILKLIRLIYLLKPKVIFSTFGYINVCLLLLRFVLPKKTIIWIREANLPSVALKHAPNSVLMSLGYFFLYRRANKLISTSEKMTQEFNKRFNVPLSKIFLLPNPIDEDYIRSNIKLESFKKSKGLKFVASGRLTYQKGFDRLISWFAELNDESNNLTILGEGPLYEELKSRICSLQIQNQVKLVGFVKNPWQYYARADAFLLSSRWEGMPNVALEALACGTIVIATKDSGGIQEIREEAFNDSVMVMDNDKEFIKSMRQTVSKNKTSLHASLLPNKYRLNKVVSIFEEWLIELG